MRDVPRRLPGGGGAQRQPALRLAADPGLRDPAERQHAARGAPAEEILPRLGGRGRGNAAPLWRLWSVLGMRRLKREAAWMMDRAVARADGADRAGAIAAAGAIGRPLARAARAASDPRAAREASGPRAADRIWDLAVALLDRLCEVGGQQARVPMAWASRPQQVVEARAARGAPVDPARL